MMKNDGYVNDCMKEEVKEIVTIFMDLPKVDRAILLNNAMAFKTLRKIEKQECIEGTDSCS